MDYEWDELKNAGNLLKHGIGFAAAEQFEWDQAVFQLDTRFDYGEERVRAYGRIGERPYCLVFSLRSGNIRIISLRPMHEKEAKRYGL